ncbi:hypothetical protein EOL72_03285 [Candidatus Falkowbacteria bacterium]|nr:hypothetical protein [Candidatus Falkowbacteria bacterium]
MPMTLYTESGDEKEVLTDEEVEALKSPANALKDVMSELGLEVGDNVTEKLEDLKTRVKELKEAESPDWRALRTRANRLDAIVKNLTAQGKEINNDGEIVEKKQLDASEIAEQAKLAARQELIQEKIEDTLEGYSEDERKVIDHYYKKLSAGEEVDLKSVDKFLKEAIKLANVDENVSAAKKSISRIGSSASNPTRGGKNFAETDAGKNVLNMMGIKLEDKK